MFAEHAIDIFVTICALYAVYLCSTGISNFAQRNAFLILFVGGVLKVYFFLSMHTFQHEHHIIYYRKRCRERSPILMKEQEYCNISREAMIENRYEEAFKHLILEISEVANSTTASWISCAVTGLVISIILVVLFIVPELRRYELRPRKAA